jgi:hypothetical protein
VKRALVVWLVIIGVEFVHGVLRTLFLAPLTGDLRARQIGVFIGSCLIVSIAYLLVPWMCVENRRSLIQVGLLWVVLTLTFEFAFGHFVVGASWERLESDYDLTHGGLLPLGLVVLMFAPLIAACMRR